MLVVDGVVTEATPQLGQVVVAESRQARPIDEHHEAVVIDDPDGLGDGLEDRLHGGDGLDLCNPRLGRRLALVHGCASPEEPI